MNQDEIGNATRQIATAILSFLVGDGMVSGDQAGALAAGAGALVSIIWSIYAHWNMKKVPETTTMKGS